MTSTIPDVATDFLTSTVWAAANRHVICKAIAEFSHERILVPLTRTDGGYRLESDDGGTEYRFDARLMALDHWNIDHASLAIDVDGAGAEPDALAFILGIRDRLGIPDDLLPVYLEEISSTLSGHCYKQSASRFTAKELASGVTRGGDVAVDFQAIEMSMTEGHPCFVANNGRLGFGAGDYLAYAPECGAPVHLEWIAAHRDHAAFTAVLGLDYRGHLRAELGPELDALEAVLTAKGLNPVDYLLIPVHPWQWENKLRIIFAPDIARRRMVHLGSGTDAYQAQQSIRTFFNSGTPGGCYVKTSLSILNMGFMRGLSAEYMSVTPAINQWLVDALAGDGVLTARCLTLLRETAAVGYRNGHLEAASPAGSPYRKMLAALWRESPLPFLEPGEQLATMSALLHRDRDGASMVATLVEQSGLWPAEWLWRFLDAYLVPVVHCLFNYELAFMPHGENVILVLRDGVPVRAIMKDIGEEVVVMGDRVEVPAEISRIRVTVPEDERVLAVLTDVFDCFLRFLNGIMVDDGLLEEPEFWGIVAGVVHRYQESTPELREQFERYNLFAADFELSCLNRLQLRNNRHMLDLANQSGGLQFAGRIANPLADFAP